MDSHTSADITAMDTSYESPKKDQIHPIFTANQLLDYNLLVKSLIDLIGENGFYFKTTKKKNIQVQVITSDGYCQIIHFLNAQKHVKFYTYQPQNEKFFRVVICT